MMIESYNSKRMTNYDTKVQFTLLPTIKTNSKEEEILSQRSRNSIFKENLLKKQKFSSYNFNYISGDTQNIFNNSNKNNSNSKRKITTSILSLNESYCKVNNSNNNSKSKSKKPKVIKDLSEIFMKNVSLTNELNKFSEKLQNDPKTKIFSKEFQKIFSKEKKIFMNSNAFKKKKKNELTQISNFADLIKETDDNINNKEKDKQNNEFGINFKKTSKEMKQSVDSYLNFIEKKRRNSLTEVEEDKRALKSDSVDPIYKMYIPGNLLVTKNTKNMLTYQPKFIRTRFKKSNNNSVITSNRNVILKPKIPKPKKVFS